MNNLILNLIKAKNPKNPLKYVHDLVKGYSAEQVNKAITDCNDCNLNCNNKFILSGNLNAKLMIIGNNLDNYKENTFNKIFDYYKADKHQVIYLPITCCNSTKLPKKNEAKRCSVFLNYFIDIVLPKVIILVGAPALNNYIEDTIFKYENKWISVKNIETLVLNHPNYLDNVDEILKEQYKVKFSKSMYAAINKSKILIKKEWC